MFLKLPQTCERALLERFLKAEAMALWAVRSAQAQDVPPRAAAFLRRHEEEEEKHLREFELLLATRSWKKAVPPQVPKQWAALAVLLYGYEALGLEFAELLASLRSDLSSILEDEKAHVDYYEQEIRRILGDGDGQARTARDFARAWWRRLPRTVDRYLRADELDPYRAELRRSILASIEHRFASVGLFDPNAGS